MEADSPSIDSPYNAPPSADEYEWILPFKYISPAGRPLSEPPIFNYDQLIRDNGIPSDARLKRLWAKDIETGYKWRDLTTEASLLYQHWTWASQMMEDETFPERAGFYKGLEAELWDDWEEVTGDRGTMNLLCDAAKKGDITQLGLWEYYHLDEDGSTTAAQNELNEGKNVFKARFGESGLDSHYCKEAFEKYGHLAPPDVYAKIKKEIGELYREIKKWEEVYKKRQQSSAEEEHQRSSQTNQTDTNPDAAAADAFTTDDENEPSPPPNLEDPLTATTNENSGLRKRIAELELANAVLKKEKYDPPDSVGSMHQRRDFQGRSSHHYFFDFAFGLASAFGFQLAR